MGFAVVLLLVPGVVLQLRSTYVDVTVLAAFLASLHFTTRPDFRTRDVWLSALALAFVGGTKATGLYYVFLLGAAGLVSTIACCVRRRSASPLVHLLGATVLLVLLVAPSYLRNWSLHHNLFWPLKFELKALGIAWAGPSDLQDMQHPFDQVVHELFSAPSPGLDYHDTRVHGYGHALPFVALPLALIALFVAARDWLLASARGDARTARIASGLLVLTVLVAMSTAGSPAYWWARYQLQIGVAILLLVVWLVGRPRWVPFGQGVLGAMLFISLITLWWADPGWDAPFKTALELMRKTHAERVVTKMSHNVSPTETLIAREREIGDGDVVVINDDFSFIGNMWNERMSNRVVWVPFRTAADYKRRLDAVAAKWVIVRRGTGGERAIKNEALRWQRVGWGYEGYHDVYRRTSM